MSTLRRKTNLAIFQLEVAVIVQLAQPRAVACVVAGCQVLPDNNVPGVAHNKAAVRLDAGCVWRQLRV